MLAGAFVADAVADVAGRIVGSRGDVGCRSADAAQARARLRRRRTARPSSSSRSRHASRSDGHRLPHLSDEFELVRETFHRFAEDKIRPVAEHVHRANADIPEDVIAGLAEIGGFGLSVPEEYGGFAAGGEHDYLGMVVATEELSWGSLGVGGSLITRPEILTRAIVQGGTEEQKRRWLPRHRQRRADGRRHGDRARLRLRRRRHQGDGDADRRRLRHQRREDVGDVRRPRQRPHAARPHRPRPDGRAPRALAVRGREGARRRATRSRSSSRAAGKIEGRAIDTLGYRGMHSYEVAFDDWFVPAENLVGGEAGLGKGFYLQMEGFENGRLQTAARAVGLMQAAFEAGLAYAQERKVFGQPVFDYQLSQAKLARMAALDPGRAAVLLRRRPPDGPGARARSQASMVKAYVCRAAEWVTREAMQLHGGMGYAEEFPVSRYFVDARVLSIFEGADETLCLRVIARRLAEQALERVGV